MDLIIKNLDRLKDYHNGHNVPIGKVVLDFDKLGKDDFTQIFFSACEKYKEPAEPTRIEHNDYINKVLDRFVEMGESYPIPAKDLKEVTQRMQGEFDATGEDVAYFMNHRTKPNIIKESDPLFVSEKLPNF